MSDKAKDKKKKVKGFKEFDPGQYIDVEPRLDEAKKGTAVFAWGRMNPMTAGHEKLVQKVISVARSEKGMPHIFLTHSFDKKKNPLAYGDKIRFAQKAFGPIVKKSDAKTIFQLMKQLERNFNRVVLIAGSDRVKEFESVLSKYNGKEYNFDEIKVVSAGARDPDADDVSGISGTKMREYAASDMKKFQSNLPAKLKGDAEEIAKAVRKGMNMSEDNESFEGEQLDEILNRQQRRKRALLMKRMKHKIKRGQEKAKHRTATMETLKKRARKQAIMNLKQRFSKNRRFAELSAGEKEVIEKRISKISKKRIEMMARKLLPKVKQNERDRRKAMVKKEDVDLNSRFETFMEDYYKGVPKDKKDDREAHFKKYAEKPGDKGADKDSNYKDAPGDIGKDGERVKTKVSKHTKKYQQMYGEDLNEWVCGVCHAEPCMCEGDGSEPLHEMWGSYVTKRPHMLMDKNGKVKFDKRFKMYKQKPDLTEELVNLVESTEDFALELNEDPTASLKKKAEKTGMPMDVLRQVYNRGVAAWKSGHRPGTTPEQWGHARVNSFVTKSSGTWGKADSDLAAKVRGSKKEEVEQVDEVLDTPKAMDSYRNKAKASKDRATNSAVANILRKGDHSSDLKTMSKREKGLKMADRNATKKTFKALRGAKTEDFDSEHAHHSQGLKDAHADMSRARTHDDMIKAMNKKARHERALSKMNRMKEEVELDEAEMSLYDKIKAARANPSPDKPVRGRGSKNRNPKTYDPRKALDKEDDRIQALVKKKLRKEEVEIEESTSVEQIDEKAPKIGVDSVAQQRKMDAAHAKAMGRSVRTGRKLPKKSMTSTQKSLASMSETVSEEETLATNANKELQDREKKEKIVKRSKREMKKKDDAEIESKARRDGGPADVSEEGGAGDQGTDKLVNKYKKDTPNC